MDIAEIKNTLNEYHHLNAEWIIFDDGEAISFCGLGENGSSILTRDDAEKAATEYLERPVS